ncbi:MAG: inorganic phosphate transporter [Planctomycetes bacterium]|nr:inorganic phosphate transporter [Planctomycetota bacterium]
MFTFLGLAALMGLGFLVWDCVEVGRNDAANLVNAVFGARALPRRTAVLIAGAAVVLGATFSSPVMETARKGIFNPAALTIHMALAIYVSVYFVDTVMLYGFSGFGMPVSTTACLVFELVGASLFLAGPANVNWAKVGTVVLGIIVSIAVSGVASFLIMRVFRGAIRDKTQDKETLLLHGPWITGAILTGLTWFMVFKGLKNVPAVKLLKSHTFQTYGDGLVLLTMWGIFTLLAHIIVVFTHRRGSRYLFHVTAVLGMICMAFAFGQNDLANAASPGLAGFTLWRNSKNPGDLADIASKIPIPIWALFGCGVVIAVGMMTRYAQRVTRAEVNTGSQFDHVALYAPEWCKALARVFIRLRGRGPSLAPEPELSDRGKKIHYDTLRASVITAVSGSVIAFASGRGLPVSTTYVAFAAVLGTGISDRVFTRGDADVKIGRAIWVITCWFLAPVIAVLATGGIARLIYHLSALGLVLGILLNVSARHVLKRRADAHERRYHHTPAPQAGEEVS